MAVENLKSLARGAFQSARSTLYAPPSNIRGVLTSIHLYNQSSGAQIISVWLVVKNSRIPLCPENFSFLIGHTAELVESPLGLEPGNYIEAQASSNNAVIFNINGYEVIL